MPTARRDVHIVFHLLYILKLCLFHDISSVQDRKFRKHCKVSRKIVNSAARVKYCHILVYFLWWRHESRSCQEKDTDVVLQQLADDRQQDMLCSSASGIGSNMGRVYGSWDSQPWNLESTTLAADLSWPEAAGSWVRLEPTLGMPSGPVHSPQALTLLWQTSPSLGPLNKLSLLLSRALGTCRFYFLEYSISESAHGFCPHGWLLHIAWVSP